LTGDVLEAFVTEVSRTRDRVCRLTLVSPWVTYVDDADVLGRLVARAVRDDASIALVTRPPSGSGHAEAIRRVSSLPRGRVVFNARLHAKVYICEQSRRRGFAVVGSANLTSASAGLDEAALLIRPSRGSALIGEIAGVAGRLGRPTRERRGRRRNTERARSLS
jgi:hypothetical protein